MQYLKPSFTLPAGNSKMTMRQWDFAMLTQTAFLEKYGDDGVGYAPAKAAGDTQRPM